MIKSLTAAALIALAPICVQAQDQDQSAIDEVLVILSSASLQTQGMAMALSNAMAKQGAKVNVLLCDAAGDLALKSYEAPALKPIDASPGHMLRGLLKQGGTASVCALYLPNSEYSKDDLIEGVSVATPPEKVGQMLSPTMRTFTF